MRIKLVLLFCDCRSIQPYLCPEEVNDSEIVRPSIRVVGLLGCMDKIIYLPNPKYPAMVGFGAHKYNGKIIVQIIIDAKGNVESANAISGHPFFRRQLEKSACQMMEYWQNFARIQLLTDLA